MRCESESRSSRRAWNNRRPPRQSPACARNTDAVNFRCCQPPQNENHRGRGGSRGFEINTEDSSVSSVVFILIAWDGSGRRLWLKPLTSSCSHRARLPNFPVQPAADGYNPTGAAWRPPRQARDLGNAGRTSCIDRKGHRNIHRRAEHARLLLASAGKPTPLFGPKR